MDAVRSYRLGRRQTAIDQTRSSILGAARAEVAAGEPLRVGRVARRAGVSRITVYNQFGTRAGLLRALTAELPAPGQPPAGGTAREMLGHRISDACTSWAEHAPLFRHLPPAAGDESVNRQLAEGLAQSDELRPGCSIKEAEDVIGLLTSFETFDRLYKDGRRSPAAVAEIIVRLASGILA